MDDQQNHMDETETLSGENPNKISRYTIAAICITVIHAAIMFTFFVPASVGVDTHGYTVQAKVIAEQGRVWYPFESDLQFYGDHWLRIDGDKLISRYPPGLPIFSAMIYKLFGSGSVILINPILTSLILPGLYLLCCLWMRPMLACAAVLIMAVNPVTNSWSYMGDSHMLVAFCLVWGLYCIARWAKTYSILMAVIGGFLLGWIPTIHYGEAIYAPAIAAYMLLYAKNTKRYWISLILAVIAASIPIFIMALHNYLAFGIFSLNGYTTNNNSTLFSLFGMVKIFMYIGNLHLVGLGWFATLGFIGFFILCKMKETRREGILLAGIAISTLLMYSAYFFFDQTQRFLLPTFYLYVISGMWIFHILFQKQFSGIKIVLITMISVSTVWGMVSTGMQISHIHQRNSLMATAGDTVRELIPEESPIVITPKNLGMHLLFVTNFKLADDLFFSDSKISPFPPPPPMDDDPNIPPGGGLGNPRDLFQVDQKMKLLDYYINEGQVLSSNLLNEIDRWLGDNKTLYWIGEKDKILPKIPVGDSRELVGTFQLDLGIGMPQHHGPDRGRPGSEGIERPDSGQDQSAMFRRPNGPPGGPPEDTPGVHPSGTNRGPGSRGPGSRGPSGRGPSGRPPELKPTTISIYKWTRNR